MDYLVVFLILLWWTVRAVIEAFHWRHDYNPIMKIDYHGWRLVESAAVVIITGITSVWILILGSWLLGYFIYEVTMHYVLEHEMFPERKPYKIGSLSIKRSWMLDTIIAAIGSAIIILHFTGLL